MKISKLIGIGMPRRHMCIVHHFHWLGWTPNEHPPGTLKAFITAALSYIHKTDEKYVLERASTHLSWRIQKKSEHSFSVLAPYIHIHHYINVCTLSLSLSLSLGINLARAVILPKLLYTFYSNLWFGRRKKNEVGLPCYRLSVSISQYTAFFNCFHLQVHLWNICFIW